MGKVIIPILIILMSISLAFADLRGVEFPNTSSSPTPSGTGLNPQLVYWDTPTTISYIPEAYYDGYYVVIDNILSQDLGGATWSVEKGVQKFYSGWIADFIAELYNPADGTNSIILNNTDNGGTLKYYFGHSSNIYPTNVFINGNLTAKNVSGQCYTFQDGTKQCTASTGGSMDYTNIAMTNTSNTFNDGQIIKGNLTLMSNASLKYAMIINTTTNQTQLDLWSANRDWHQGLMVQPDPQTPNAQSLYVLGNTGAGGGRIYFGCWSAGTQTIVPCYSMDFRNVTNWVSVPATISQQGTAISAYCPSGTCSAHVAGSGDLVLAGGGANTFITANQRPSGTSFVENELAFKSYANLSTYYKSGYATYFDTNDNKFNYTYVPYGWKVANTEVMKIDSNGTLSVKETFKLPSITLPTCNGDYAGSLGRNGTGLYFCNNTDWRFIIA